MPYKYPKPGDKLESDLFSLHRMLASLYDSNGGVEIESGVLGVPRDCGCCDDSYDLAVFTDALEEMLGIQELSTEEMKAEEERRFEEGKARYREEHPEHFEDGVRTPEYWDKKVGRDG
jgi:hypothetical protein